MKRLNGVLLLAFLTGCGVDPGVGDRFQAERGLWNANREARRQSIRPDLVDETARRDLAGRFRGIGDRFGAAAPDTSSIVVTDTRRVAARALLNAGRMYVALGDSAPAGEIFEQVRRSFPEFPELSAEGAFGSATLAEGAGRAGDAADAYQHVVTTLQPDLSAGGARAAVVRLPTRMARLRLREAGPEVENPAAFYDPALAYYEALLSRNPEPGVELEARYSYVDALTDLGRWDQVIEQLGVIENNLEGMERPLRDPAEARYLRTQAMRRRGDPIESGEVLLRSIVTDYPRSGYAVRSLLTLGVVAAEAGRHDEALAAFAELRGAYAEPEALRAEALLREARLLRTLGRWPEARELFLSLPREHPLTAPALEAPLDVVRYYEDQKDDDGRRAALEDAEAVYRSIMEEYPAPEFSARAQDKLTVVLLLQDRKREALTELERVAVTLRGSREGAMALLRAATLALGEFQDTTRAIALLEKTGEWYEETDLGRRAIQEAARLRGKPQS